MHQRKQEGARMKCLLAAGDIKITLKKVGGIKEKRPALERAGRC
jgi:hypothetical protein